MAILGTVKINPSTETFREILRPVTFWTYDKAGNLSVMLNGSLSKDHPHLPLFFFLKSKILVIYTQLIFILAVSDRTSRIGYVG